MNFPCMICHYVFDGEILWNVHSQSVVEDRHLLCNFCLIKFCSKNIQCPLKCNNHYHPSDHN